MNKKIQNHKFFTEKRLVFREILKYEECPMEKPNEKPGEIDKRLACLERNEKLYKGRYEKGVDPSYDKLKEAGVFDEEKEIQRTLRNFEIPILRKSMKIFHKHLMHFSFWSTVRGLGAEKEVRDAIKTVMKYKCELEYDDKEKDGFIVIKKRPGSKNVKDGFRIEIKVTTIEGDKKRQIGVIRRVGKISIDSPITNFDNEWDEIEERMTKVSQNVRHGNPTEIEKEWFAKYSMELPRMVLNLLQLKRKLSPAEKKVKRKIATLLKNQPKNYEDWQNNRSEYKDLKQLRIFSDITPPNLLSSTHPGTPKGQFELFERVGGSEKHFATFSREGVLTWPTK